MGSSVFLVSSEEAAGVTGRYFESNAKEKLPSASALDAGNQGRARELAASLAARAPTAGARGRGAPGTALAETMANSTRRRFRDDRF